MLLTSRRRRIVDIWPGFVDGLAALLMVVIFVLLLFSVGQFMLTDALVGRDRALDSLRSQIAQLADVLSMERKEKAALESRLSALSSELAGAVKARDELAARLQSMTLRAEDAAASSERLGGELAAAREQIRAAEATLEEQRGTIVELEQERTRLQATLEASRQETAQQQALSERAQTQVDELNAQIAALREQLLQITHALDISESQVKEQSVEIEDLGRRLNVALADKVEELAGYRSEFFGKLREALQDNPDIRVEGDRFVLPSEVLFGSASADLDPQGKREIATIARTLKEITTQIPKDLDWVLRVDGHTDKRPIRVAFPSNWELSSARATSIVKYMIEQGVPAEHLVAAGFGQYHPIDPDDTEEAYRRNRRIELKLTSR
ncbi:peptidoglycan -binding protein [Thiogranum longum]